MLDAVMGQITRLKGRVGARDRIRLDQHFESIRAIEQRLGAPQAACALGARVKADTTRASIDEILKELSEIAGARPVTDQERGEAVGGMLLGFPGDFERMSSVAGQLTSLILDGHPADYLSTWPARMGAITTADANAMAKKYAVGDFVIVVVGDKAALLPTLEGLGLPVIEHDGQGNLLPVAPPAAPPTEAPVQQAAR
ncbi:MAG: DUF1552 domain-containing protein [bacterium]